MFNPRFTLDQRVRIVCKEHRRFGEQGDVRQIQYSKSCSELSAQPYYSYHIQIRGYDWLWIDEDALEAVEAVEEEHKFYIGQQVRVTAEYMGHYNRVGVVTHYAISGTCLVRFDDAQFHYWEHELEAVEEDTRDAESPNKQFRPGQHVLIDESTIDLHNTVWTVVYTLKSGAIKVETEDPSYESGRRIVYADPDKLIAVPYAIGQRVQIVCPGRWCGARGEVAGYQKMWSGKLVLKILMDNWSKTETRWYEKDVVAIAEEDDPVYDTDSDFPLLGTTWTSGKIAFVLKHAIKDEDGVVKYSGTPYGIYHTADEIAIEYKKVVQERDA